MRPTTDDPGKALALKHFALVMVATVFLFSSGILAAQEAPPALEFSFSNPGARSLGLGGAFAALADDATAAFANPAGLVQLLRPEVSLELRRRKYSTPYTEGGRALGAPTGWGIDTIDGIRTANSNETTSGISFLSFVYPGTKWSLALFRHQLADFRACRLGPVLRRLCFSVPLGQLPAPPHRDLPEDLAKLAAEDSQP